MVVPIFIFISYGIPSALLTLLVMICILRDRSLMEGSFYRCYLFILFVHITSYINSWIVVKFRSLESFTWIYLGIQDYFPPYRLFYTYQFASFYIQNCALLLLHLNRFTAIWWPIKHIKLWGLRNIFYLGFAIYVLGFSICYADFYIGPLYVLTDGLARDNLALWPEVWLSVFLMPRLGHVFPVVAFVLNLLTFGKILYLRVKGKQTNGVLVEINLFFICLSTFIVQLAQMFYYDQALTLWRTPEMIILMQTVMGDFFALSEAYIGLALNRTIRGKLWAMTFARFTKKSDVSEVKNSSEGSKKKTRRVPKSEIKI